MVGRSGGAFALAGFFVAGLSTLLRLTTPFDSGLVRFAKPHKEAALWRLPQTRCTRYLLFPSMPLQTLPYWLIIVKISPNPD